MAQLVRVREIVSLVGGSINNPNPEGVKKAKELFRSEGPEFEPAEVSELSPILKFSPKEHLHSAKELHELQECIRELARDKGILKEEMKIALGEIKTKKPEEFLTKLDEQITAKGLNLLSDALKMNKDRIPHELIPVVMKKIVELGSDEKLKNAVWLSQFYPADYVPEYEGVKMSDILDEKLGALTEILESHEKYPTEYMPDLLKKMPERPKDPKDFWKYKKDLDDYKTALNSHDSKLDDHFKDIQELDMLVKDISVLIQGKHVGESQLSKIIESYPHAAPLIEKIKDTEKIRSGKDVGGELRAIHTKLKLAVLHAELESLEKATPDTMRDEKIKEIRAKIKRLEAPKSSRPERGDYIDWYWGAKLIVQTKRKELPEDLLRLEDPGVRMVEQSLERGRDFSVPPAEEGILGGKEIEELMGRLLGKGKGEPIQTRRDLLSTAMVAHEQGFITEELRDKMLEEVFKNEPGREKILDYVRGSSPKYFQEQGIIPIEYLEHKGAVQPLPEKKARKK